MATINNLEKILSEIIKTRKSKGLSCENMADELNISIAAYHKLEKGKTRIHLKRFLEICRILKIEPSQLITANPENNVRHNVVLNEFSIRYENLYQRNLELSSKLIENLEKRIREIKNDQ